MAPKPVPVSTRLWARVERAGADECWPWTGARNNGTTGYGVLKGEGKALVYAHRVAYELGHGVAPGPLVVLHRCDNPVCCNPNHLSLGTQAENVADMFAKGRQPDFRATGAHRGTKNGRAKLSDEQVDTARRMFEKGSTLAAVAKLLGIGTSQAHRLRSGKAWAHVYSPEELGAE